MSETNMILADIHRYNLILVVQKLLKDATEKNTNATLKQQELEELVKSEVSNISDRVDYSYNRKKDSLKQEIASTNAQIDLYQETIAIAKINLNTSLEKIKNVKIQSNEKDIHVIIENTIQELDKLRNNITDNLNELKETTFETANTTILKTKESNTEKYDTEINLIGIEINQYNKLLEFTDLKNKAIKESELMLDDSLFEKEMLGLLYGNDDILEYYNFETKKRIKLKAKTKRTIWTVYNNETTDKTLFGTINGKICALEDGLKQKRSDFIQSINSFNGLTIDANDDGLYNTLTNEILISKKDLTNKNIKYINSLNGFNNSLYALVRNSDKSHSVVEINTSNHNNFFIGETIKNYDVSHGSICDFAIIPQESMRGDNDKDYPFSIITCANMDYLDLNGEKIVETEVKNSSNQSINRLKLIKSTNT
ncbi:MAG: hypothetical protein KKH40_02690, partial [Nanoarchaeota archaeon]|nr:hypothetical protein [Nanoarchaeota archaeon]